MTSKHSRNFAWTTISSTSKLSVLKALLCVYFWILLYFSTIICSASAVCLLWHCVGLIFEFPFRFYDFLRGKLWFENRIKASFWSETCKKCQILSSISLLAPSPFFFLRFKITILSTSLVKWIKRDNLSGCITLLLKLNCRSKRFYV